MTKQIDKIMEQAQVFASAWSLVGGRFDGGNAMAEAEVAKNELSQMIKEALAEQPAQQEPVAAAKKDAVFAASIEFIGILTGMQPPPIEVAPPEIFKPFRDFTEKVCSIFATSPPAQQEPVGPEYIGIPVAYQYCYPDGAWRCSFGDEINGSKPIASRALYARKDGK